MIDYWKFLWPYTCIYFLHKYCSYEQNFVTILQDHHAVTLTLCQRTSSTYKHDFCDWIIMIGHCMPDYIFSGHFQITKPAYDVMIVLAYQDYFGWMATMLIVQGMPKVN